MNARAGTISKCAALFYISLRLQAYQVKKVIVSYASLHLFPKDNIAQGFSGKNVRLLVSETRRKS